MMSSLFCLLVILFLSLHACNARPLGLSTKESNKKLLLSGKDSSIAEEIIHESQGAEKATPVPKDTKALGMKEKNEKATKVMKTSLQQDFQETEAETWKRQARSTLQSMPHNEEETVNPKENDLPEDVVVMDYAQPHRKPPIHNMEP